MNLKPVICKVLGHDWEVVGHIPAPGNTPGSVPADQVRCRRCGAVALHAVLKPGQAVAVPGVRLVVREER